MMIPISDLHGKSLALLIWYINENMDSTAAIVSGTAEIRGAKMSLVRGSFLPKMQVPGRLLTRVKSVPAEAKDIFGDAEYFLELTINDLPNANQKEKFYHLPETG